MAARDALEDALQDSFDELDQAPWVVQFFCQDDSDFAPYLERLERYVAPRAGTPFTEAFLASMQHHLDAIAKPGGLFDDHVVSRLPGAAAIGGFAWWSIAGSVTRPTTKGKTRSAC
jgi:hypothetical protein